ncbi:hypothetical protein UT300005_20040 [Clostridium sp. CTA-5]
MKNYFKKILIMFVMILTIMGIGAISNSYVANAATVGEQLLQPETGWKRINVGPENNNFSYEGTWTKYTNSTGYFNRDRYELSGKGKIKVNFTSNKIRIILACFWSNSSKFKVYIDGNLEEEFNSRQFGDKDWLNSQLSFEKTNMSNQEHSLEIEVLEEGYYFQMDAIDISENGILKPYTKISAPIALNKSSLSLKECTSEKLTTTTTTAGAKVVWSSSDEKIAKVDENGIVTGVKEGQVTITAQIKGSETKAICTVTVTKTPDTNGENTTPTNPTDNSDGTSTGTEGTSNIVNIAHAKGDNTNNASGQVSIIFKGIAEAQLKVVKTADVDSVYVGDTFTYTIEVTNTSDKVAKSVVINDNAPNHIDFIVNGVTATQGKIDPSSTSKNIVVNVGDIPPSGKVTIKIPANVVL